MLWSMSGLGQGDLDLAVDGADLGNLRPRLEQVDGLGLVAGNAHPHDPALRHLVAHALHRAAVDQLALLDNRHAVAQGLEFAQDVRGDDDGLAQALQLLQDGHHLDARPRVEAAGRLVQQQQLRVVDQHPRQARAAAACPGSARR